MTSNSESIRNVMSEDMSVTRRRLLLSGALGGSALLAGCLGGDDDGSSGDGDLPEDVRVDGQRLYLPIEENPDEMNFLYHVDTELLGVPEMSSGHEVRRATSEPGIWGRWWSTAYSPAMGENFFGLYEDYDIGVETASFTLRDDIYWSDGEPITARDTVANWLFWRTRYPDEDLPSATAQTVEGVSHTTMPDGPDGKVVEYHLWDDEEWRDLGGFARDPYFFLLYVAGPSPRDGVRHPAHVEPWDTVTEAAWEDLQEDGWVGDRDHYAEEYMTEEDIYNWRDGDHFVSSGAWTLKEIVGTQEVVLEPNEHHPRADEINYDEVVLEWSEEDHRTEASLQSGTPESLDYAQVNLPPESVENLPDQYTETTSPADDGLVLGIDHSTAFGDVQVRQAIMYALNSEDIAQNVHPTAARPVVTPGWDMWAVDAVLDEDWAEENLISYEQDLDRAAELMEEAGYTLQDDVWHRDGEPFETQLHTPRDAPAFEETVASQLRDFGIDMEVMSMDEATFEEGLEGAEEEYIEDEYGGKGRYDIWARGGAEGFAGYYVNLQGEWWGFGAKNAFVRQWNLYDHEAQEEGLREYPGAWVAGEYEHWEEWTIDIPPAGEPDGELQPFNPGFTTGRVRVGPFDEDDPQDDNPYYNPEEEGVNYWQKLAWTLNWYLPALPIVRQEDQHFLNTENWYWPSELGGEANEYMWEYFGMGWDSLDLAGMGRVLADPDNPKDDAEVVDR